jgi:hypothetical protein
MGSLARIGAPKADVVVFNKGNRETRFELLQQGREVPREFFYGYFDLEKAGMPCAMVASSGRFPGTAGFVADILERGVARVTAVGARPLSARLIAREVNDAKVFISNTDGFSLSMGLGLGKRAKRPALLGGFQGLSDVEGRVAGPIKPLARRMIMAALDRLDHVFFLSPSDRNNVIARYGIPAAKTSLFEFGVDTAFWRPEPEAARDDYVFSIGQDWNRDFQCLVEAPLSRRIRIVTSLSVRVPAGRNGVEVLKGEFSGARITDEDLRRIYNAARVVVVPSKDVHQPAGQSVALQAMSCGRPVIISGIKGLWAPEKVRDGENCLIVPPGDRGALARAIETVFSDEAFARRLGNAARETVESNFALKDMGESIVGLARLGLSIFEARNRAADRHH